MLSSTTTSNPRFGQSFILVLLQIGLFRASSSANNTLEKKLRRGCFTPLFSPQSYLSRCPGILELPFANCRKHTSPSRSVYLRFTRCCKRRRRATRVVTSERRAEKPHLLPLNRKQNGITTKWPEWYSPVRRMCFQISLVTSRIRNNVPLSGDEQHFVFGVLP